MNFLKDTLPQQATEMAVAWDNLYYFLFIVCVVFFAIVIIPMIYFAIKYRARPGHRADASFEHNTPLEIVWTAIPTVIVMVIFVWGWIVYENMQYNVPRDAMDVRVIAQSWSWTFQYDDGRTELNQLVVPVNTPVKLSITSKRNDVLHSFFVPNFRIKKDAVPGYFTTTWFKADTIGQHIIFCTEYCGNMHSAMLAKVVVLSEEDFKLWKWGKKIEFPPPVGLLPAVNPGQFPIQQTAQANQFPNSTAFRHEFDLVKNGRRLTELRGCVACHSEDGATSIGPSYRSLFGKSVELTDGSEVIVDENYIRESLEFPQKKVVKGYESKIMPSFAGQWSEEEMNSLIAYLKSLK